MLIACKCNLMSLTVKFTQKCHEPLLESLKVRFDASDFITIAKHEARSITI
jgi:hypothetical protein